MHFTNNSLQNAYFLCMRKHDPACVSEILPFTFMLCCSFAKSSWPTTFTCTRYTYLSTQFPTKSRIVFSSCAYVYLMLCTNVSMTSKVHEGALWLYEHFCICGEDGVKSLEKTRRLALAATSGRTNPLNEIEENERMT